MDQAMSINAILAERFVSIMSEMCTFAFYPTAFAYAFVFQAFVQLLSGAMPSPYATCAACATLVGRFRYGKPTWRQLVAGVKGELGGRTQAAAAGVWAGAVAVACAAWLYLKPVPVQADTVADLLCIASSYRYARRGEHWSLAVAHFTAVYSFGRWSGLAPGLVLVSARMLLHVALLYLRVLLVAGLGLAALVWTTFLVGIFYGQAAVIRVFQMARVARPAAGPVPLPTSWSQLLGEGEWLGEGERMTMPGPIGTWVNDLVAYQPDINGPAGQHDAQGCFKLQAVGGGTYPVTANDGTRRFYGLQYNVRFYSLPADYEGAQQGAAAAAAAAGQVPAGHGAAAALAPQGSGGALAERVTGSAARTLLRQTSSKTLEF